MSKTYSAGIVTAYGAAKRAGYTGTYEDFCRQQAGYAESAAVVEQAKNTAVSAANTATAKASEATTAATDAQTAKTQTEAAASQALTDISIARSGAISAVQTEGQTQTANARAQAQAAKASATTASTKASEASASATSAGQSATNAAASATSAAQSASNAQDVLDSIPADYSDLSEDVDQLKADLGVLSSGSARTFVTGHYINANGNESGAVNNYACTDYVPCSEKSIIRMFDVYVGESAYAYTFYDATKTRLSGQNSVSGNISVVVPAEAKYVRFSSRITNETPSVVVLNEKTLEGSVESIEIKVEELPSTLKVEPKNTTFFKAINYFDPTKSVYYTDRFLQITSWKITASTSAKMLIIPVKPNTEYYLNIPNANRYVVGVTNDNDFSLGKTFSLLVNPVVSSYPQHFTTGATTSKVGIYFNSGDYDYDNNKDKIVLNIGSYTGEETPYIPYDYLPKDISSVLKDAQVLIFGDSITSTCNFTINADKETTAMMWKSPSNSYVDAGGNTVRYSMWPKILKDNQPCGEIRNYAMSGASYRTQTRESGYERQNLQYQIDVALNDIDNPNNVFGVADYVPDIVIFALGTNDGVPNDTYDSAMSATVYDSTVSTAIDVDATISALDESKTIASARKAFMRIKKAFPLAQIFCVLPIQRANNDTNLGVLHDYLKQIAQRYGCIIIDGASDSGIMRDGNIENALGVYLKDGLHPNEKGQNLMARMIISSLKSHYLPFGTGFNQVN